MNTLFKAAFLLQKNAALNQYFIYINEKRTKRIGTIDTMQCNEYRIEN